MPKHHCCPASSSSVPFLKDVAAFREIKNKFEIIKVLNRIPKPTQLITSGISKLDLIMGENLTLLIIIVTL